LSTVFFIEDGVRQAVVVEILISLLILQCGQESWSHTTMCVPPCSRNFGGGNGHRL